MSYTKWTKTGVTSREVTTRVDGPSQLKEDIVVPKGTAVRWIGRWVVGDLGWLAAQVGASLRAAMPGIGNGRDEVHIGRNSITFSDADHYGITIDEADVSDVRDVEGDGVHASRTDRQRS